MVIFHLMTDLYAQLKLLTFLTVKTCDFSATLMLLTFGRLWNLLITTPGIYSSLSSLLTYLHNCQHQKRLIDLKSIKNSLSIFNTYIWKYQQWIYLCQWSFRAEGVGEGCTSAGVHCAMKHFPRTTDRSTNDSLQLQLLVWPLTFVSSSCSLHSTNKTFTAQ